jgi:trimethylamine--corrinoid protein Co-methyltransferase
MSPLIGALSGVSFIVIGGLLDALMSFDFGQVVIDDEIARMIKRVRQGFGFSKESVALDEIKATGPAGMFADNPRTLEHMADAALLPALADRKPREQWAVEGASTIHQRAMNRALDILSQPNTASLDAAIDARIRGHFDGLVAGDSLLPEGWVRQGETSARPHRERRVNRRRGGSGT